MKAVTGTVADECRWGLALWVERCGAVEEEQLLRQMSAPVPSYVSSGILLTCLIALMCMVQFGCRFFV